MRASRKWARRQARPRPVSGPRPLVVDASGLRERLVRQPRLSVAREGILSTIGNTPLVRLTRALPGVPLRVFAKLESFNPSGSIKVRAAFRILRHAIDAGNIRPGATVIESSSGNMGIGLAQLCAYFGLRLVCVVDPRTTSENLAILRAYGAEVDMVSEPDPTTGEFLQARLDRVQSLLRSMPNSFKPSCMATLADCCHEADDSHAIHSRQSCRVKTQKSREAPDSHRRLQRASVHSCTVTFTGSTKLALNAATSAGFMKPSCSHSR